MLDFYSRRVDIVNEMRNLDYNQNEGPDVNVFSGRRLAHILRQRNLKVSDLYRDLVRRDWPKSQQMIYRWINGKSVPNVNDLALLEYMLRCKKDDFYEEDGRVN